MSMQPRPWPEVPAETTRVARRAFRKGTLAIRARDELGSWCDDEDFAAAYGVRGRPGISPAQLAMVTVLQFTENLTDRQAADAVRGRLDWKYCLGLELGDDGFDFSVLSEFRGRLVAGGAERAVFDLLLGQLRGRGLVAAGGRQRTDSTHVLARIRDLSRLELAGESVRAALEALAAAAPGWLATVIDASWQEAYGQRVDQIRLPASQAKRGALAVRYGRDGYRLLAAVRGPAAPSWLRDLPAVQVLRQVWVQQYYREVSGRGEKVIWREAEQGLPPGRARIVSPYDTDARCSQKRATRWAGYKAHLTETVTDAAADDPATGRPSVPNLITNVATTPAPVTDHEMTGPVHDSLDDRQVLPGEHLVDAGYASADALLSARARGITLLGPLLAGAPPGGHAARYPATSRPPAPGAPPAPPGPAATTATRSSSSSRPPPAGPARPVPSAPPPRPAAASSACGPGPSTKPSPPPARSRTPISGKPATPPAPASRAPSARPPRSPASAAPATPDCPRPPSSTPSPPPPSTSSASTPGGPAAPSTAAAPPASSDSTSPPPPNPGKPTASVPGSHRTSLSWLPPRGAEPRGKQEAIGHLDHRQV